MILQGWSRTVQKILQARRFIQRHRGEKAASKSHFANLGSLLLVGRAAGKEHLPHSSETGNLKQGETAEQSSGPRTGGQELINISDNDPLRCRMGTTHYSLLALFHISPPKELINSPLERQKSLQGREQAEGGTSEEKPGG